MKKALKFMKIDFAMSKGQNKVYLFLVAIAILFTVMNQNPLFVAVYLTFGAVILANAPFSLENYYNMAFVNLLPATTRSRVSGRYMFSILYLITSTLIAEITGLFTATEIQEERFMIFLFPLFMCGLSLIFITIQYVLMYALGIGKNQQYIRLISMVPGFVMFGVGSGLSEVAKGVSITGSMITMGVLATLVFGIIVMLVGKELTILIVKRRDSI